MGLFNNDGIFGGSSNASSSANSSDSCSLPSGVESLTIRGTAHQEMYYAAAGCAAVTFISSVVLIFLHLSRYRAPKEQRQIIRIVWTPFVFAIISFAEVANYTIAPYIDSVASIYEAFGLCAIFLLFVQFCVPNGTFGEELFEAMHTKTESHDQDGKHNWPRMSWLFVFQYPVTDLIAIIILEATQATGTYCSSSLKPKHGHLWSQLISTVGVSICVMSIFKFYGKMKTLMKARKAMVKLLGFKVIVFLGFVQNWLFSILIDRHVLKESDHFSYGDFVYGLPNTLLAAEMVIISLLMWYAYSPSEYSKNVRPREPSLDFFQAIFNALNPSDLIVGIGHAFRLLPLAISERSASNKNSMASLPIQYAPVGYAHRHPGSYD